MRFGREIAFSGEVRLLSLNEVRSSKQNEIQIEKSERLKCSSQEAIKDVSLNEKVVDIIASFQSFYKVFIH